MTYWFGAGHRVRVAQTGAGEPLLLISGLGSHLGMWAPFAAEFPERRIIRFDMPGTGLSSTPLYPIAITALAHLAVAVLDHYATPRADVVGFSYGGAVAQQAACDYPERIRRLVLAATTCGVGGVPGSIARHDGARHAAALLLAPLLRASRGGFVRGRHRARPRCPRAADAHSESGTAAVFVRLRDAAARGERVVQSAVPRRLSRTKHSSSTVTTTHWCRSRTRKFSPTVSRARVSRS